MPTATRKRKSARRRGQAVLLAGLRTLLVMVVIGVVTAALVFAPAWTEVEGWLGSVMFGGLLLLFATTSWALPVRKHRQPAST